MFSNLKTVLFPNTEFRSAFAQTADKGNLALCTKTTAAKVKTRGAYLWAYRVPQLDQAGVRAGQSAESAAGDQIDGGIEGRQGNQRAKIWPWRATGSSFRLRDGGTFNVPVTPTPAGALEVDLAKAKIPAGDYHLAFTWDWDPLAVAGTLHVHPVDDFSKVAFTAAEHDKLVEGSGLVTVTLSGADFEFLEKATLLSPGHGAKPADAEFNLPLGKRGGPQNVVAFDIDTAKQGTYLLTLAQADGVTHKVPFTVLPPNPKISNLPLRFNTGEAQQAIRSQRCGCRSHRSRSRQRPARSRARSMTTTGPARFI